MTSQTVHYWLIVVSVMSVTCDVKKEGGGVGGESRVFADRAKDFVFKAKYSEHPLLYFDSLQAVKLANQASGSHRDVMYQLIELAMRVKQGNLMPPANENDYRKSCDERVATRLPSLALYCLLLPEDTKAQVRLLTYLDRVASYSSWYLTDAPEEDVPVSNMLLGFATAIDMAYTRLTPARRQLYFSKAYNVTKSLYEFSQSRWWSGTYLMDKGITNFLALFVSSLVLEPHARSATEWKMHATRQLDRNMQLLRHVTDGSVPAGVGYGSTIVRALCQYVFLTKRHLDFSYEASPWFKNVFSFYYHTLAPGLHRTAGIADSGPDWFSGPESELVFLDTVYLKNGSGNWLARQVRKYRMSLDDDHHQKYTNLHTEYVWLNPALGYNAPLGDKQPHLHHFTDWGVVTYSSGSVEERTNTYLTFKSSKSHGSAMFDIVQKSKTGEVDGWNTFRCDSEHPDQNSFTFAPNGEEFITEGLMSAKHTYLDSVLMFKPSTVSECTVPWAGQLGDCGMWLNCRGPESSHITATVVAAELKDGVVFTSGEAVGAYHSSLRLSSVYRALVLLNKELLVIVDVITLAPNSTTTHVAAFFNNYARPFVLTEHRSGLKGLHVDSTDKTVADSLWLTSRAQSPAPQLSQKVVHGPNGPTSTYNANVTFTLEGRRTVIVYAMYGLGVQVSHVSFADDNTRDDVTSFTIGTMRMRYDIDILTEYRRKRTKDTPPLYRVTQLPPELAVKTTTTSTTTTTTTTTTTPPVTSKVEPVEVKVKEEVVSMESSWLETVQRRSRRWWSVMRRNTRKFYASLLLLAGFCLLFIQWIIMPLCSVICKPCLRRRRRVCYDDLREVCGNLLRKSNAVYQKNKRR